MQILHNSDPVFIISRGGTENTKENEELEDFLTDLSISGQWSVTSGQSWWRGLSPIRYGQAAMLKRIGDNPRHLSNLPPAYFRGKAARGVCL